MKNQNLSVRKLARCGMVAALYVVLCMALQPFSYGAVQVRVAEALCLLPVFGAEYIFGVVLGCFLANLLGSTIVDVIFGTLATLLACLVTYKLRNIRFKGLALAASLPPVVFNAVIIGIEIAVMFPDPSSSAPLWLACVTNGISVGIGELICWSASSRQARRSGRSSSPELDPFRRAGLIEQALCRGMKGYFIGLLGLSDDRYRTAKRRTGNCAALFLPLDFTTMKCFIIKHGKEACLQFRRKS